MVDLNYTPKSLQRKKQIKLKKFCKRQRPHSIHSLAQNLINSFLKGEEFKIRSKWIYLPEGGF
jgi:hypothetical protein